MLRFDSTLIPILPQQLSLTTRSNNRKRLPLVIQFTAGATPLHYVPGIHIAILAIPPG
jgi:hypothetical protein